MDQDSPVQPDTGRVTALLLRWNAGDSQALHQLTPVIYEELRNLARILLSDERPGQTLSATGLVHEAYLKLVDQRQVNWSNRAHFFGAASRIMRQVLVDQARAKLTQKRGGRPEKIAMRDDMAPAELLMEEILSLDQALSKLAELDERKAHVVEMKFFAGMTNRETALALGVSDATVERDWTMARAWLIKALDGRQISGM